MAITYNNLYLDIRTQLRKAGIEAATLEARELVCLGTGKTREELTRDGSLYASPELERQVRRLVDRHLAEEPVAYLIGEWEFYGLPLDISEDVLIPRADTEVLAEQAIAYCQTLPECRVLDLCAGSGCVGLSLASLAPHARVTLADASREAMEVARENMRALGAKVRLCHGDLFDAVGRERFDLIASNPPYIPHGDMAVLQREVLHEPAMALDGGADGLDFYRRIASEAPNHLNAGGAIYLEVGQGEAEAVLALVREHIDCAEAGAIKDLNGIDRVVYARSK